MKRLGLDNAAVLELDLAALLDMKVSEIKFKPTSRFPSVSRDIAVVLDENIAFEDIAREASKADSLIRKVNVFDVYQGKGIPEGKKSLAITLTLSSDERTLKEEEIALAVKKAVDALSTKFLAEIRG